MSVNEQSIPSIAHYASFRSVGDEVFILHLETKGSYALNETAARIWTLIDGQRSVGDIAQFIVAEYEIHEDECLAAVTGIIGELVDEKLLVIA